MLIDGWVEVTRGRVREPGPGFIWHPVIYASGFLADNDTIAGCMFGVRNNTDFTPVAPDRGLPPDVSAPVAHDLQAIGQLGGRYPTWISWPELQVVDWDEMALDGWAHGRDRHGACGVKLPRGDPQRVEGTSWVEDGCTYRVEKVTRREACGPEWQLLMDLMATLAAHYGDGHVRLVVCFDLS